MTASCQPLPPALIGALLQKAARALCDHPEEGGAGKPARIDALVHAVIGMAPRDSLEYMLATLVAGHFDMILQAMHDALADQSDGRRVATVIALDRALLALIKQLAALRVRSGPEEEVAVVAADVAPAAESHSRAHRRLLAKRSGRRAAKPVMARPARAPHSGPAPSGTPPAP